MPLLDPVTMSAPTAKSDPAAAGPAIRVLPLLQPVQVPTTTVAQAGTKLQTFLVGLLFLAAWKALVRDPVDMMRKTLPVFVAIQTGYVLLCLPPAGSQGLEAAKKPRPGSKKKPEAGPNVFTTAALSLALTTIATPVIYVAFVLFGAPFLELLPHTLLCAAHFANLAVFPLFYAHGVDGDAWRTIAGAAAPSDEVFGGLVGGVAGAWLGAVPIPLDWDREWQKWPVTILAGIYAGYLLGKVVGGGPAFGKRFGHAAPQDKKKDE